MKRVFSEHRVITVLGAAIAVVLVLGVLGWVTKGANGPKDPYLAPVGESSLPRSPLPGFGETKVSVQNQDGLLEWCLLLASTPQQRNRGLMYITDPALAGYDGMLFRWDDDTSETFWMKNTKLPLTVGFFSSDGHIVSQTDMDPCPDSGPCPSHAPAGPYRVAIEVPQGKFATLGLTPDSVVTDQQQPC